MSRSGYVDGDFDNWSMIKWRGAVASAMRGKRGREFLREAIEALDALPEKRLIAHNLQVDGEVCTLGAVGVKRGLDLKPLDPKDYASLSHTFNIASPLVQEIEYMNDDVFYRETPEQRFIRMRKWLVRELDSVEKFIEKRAPK